MRTSFARLKSASPGFTHESNAVLSPALAVNELAAAGGVRSIENNPLATGEFACPALQATDFNVEVVAMASGALNVEPFVHVPIKVPTSYQKGEN
ncbi:MAG TPA: hypothetical protein PKD60_09715 [Turneriella sp.]|nr:hypothetical protein [Turneriella sp.]